MGLYPHCCPDERLGKGASEQGRRSGPCAERSGERLLSADHPCAVRRDNGEVLRGYEWSEGPRRQGKSLWRYRGYGGHPSRSDGLCQRRGRRQVCPNALVTREQAAAMLSRVYTKLGSSIPAVTATTFADNGSVSNWARDAVAFMSDKGIVTGVGDNKFNPKGNASIEQALAIAVRMFDNLK